MLQIAYILAVLLIYIFVDFILAYRYRLLLGSIKERITLMQSFYIHCTSQFLSYFTPFRIGFIAIKPVVTKIFSGIMIKKSIFISISEQVYEVGWQVLIFPFLLLLIGEKAMLNNITVEILIIAIFFISLILVVKKRERFVFHLWRLKRLLPRRIKRMGKKAELTERNVNEQLNSVVSSLSNWRLLVAISIPTLAIMLLLPISIYLFGLLFSVQISYKMAFIVYWVSVIIGRLSGIPGGLVSKDLTVIGLLTLFGIDPVTSLEIALLYRVLVMLPKVAIGAPIFLYSGGNAMLKRIAGGREK